VYTRQALPKRGSGGNFAVTHSLVWKFCCVGGATILQ